MRKGVWLIALLLDACAILSEPSVPSGTLPPASPTLTFSPADTATREPSVTCSPSPAATWTRTPEPSFTPTPSGTPTVTLSPAPDIPAAMGLMDANCRYGPGTVYLYKLTFHEGDTAVVDGRNYTGSWLWISPEGVDFHCWVSAETVETSVPVDQILRVYPPLPTNDSVASLSGVTASRSNSSVTISWNAAPPSLELAYLVEARVCQSGHLIEVVQTTTSTSMTLTDEKTCSSESSALVRTQNKLGYSIPVQVPWPK